MGGVRGGGPSALQGPWHVLCHSNLPCDVLSSGRAALCVGFSKKCRTLPSRFSLVT